MNDKAQKNHRGVRAKKPHVLGAGAVVLIVAATGCGSPTPSFTEVQALMNVSCNLSSCHGSAKEGMLSLNAADAYCALVGTTGGATFLSTARAQFPRRVVPGSRDASFIYKKLTLTTSESGPSKPFGDVMPQNQPFIDKTNIEVIDEKVAHGSMTQERADAMKERIANGETFFGVGGGFAVDDALIEAARKISVPVQFLLPWDDEHVDRQSSLALFDAFASEEKTLHANPGDHRTIRWFGLDTEFLPRHLGRPSADASSLLVNADEQGPRV